MIREKRVQVVSLGIGATLKSEAEKCGNQPSHAGGADYESCSFEKRGGEDAAVQEQDGDLDHENGKSVGNHSGIECLDSVIFSNLLSGWDEGLQADLQKRCNLALSQCIGMPASSSTRDHWTCQPLREQCLNHQTN